MRCQQLLAKGNEDIYSDTGLHKTSLLLKAATTIGIFDGKNALFALWRCQSGTEKAECHLISFKKKDYCGLKLFGFS